MKHSVLPKNAQEVAGLIHPFLEAIRFIGPFWYGHVCEVFRQIRPVSEEEIREL